MFVSIVRRAAFVCASVAAVAATVAASAPASAAAAQFPAAKVHYADLDLASAVGQRIFVRRVSRAVDAVCGEPSSETLGCRRFAEASAAPQVEMATAAAQVRAGN